MGIGIGVILAGVIMLASFVGMLFCAKLQRSQPNAKFLAIGLLCVVLLCGSYILSDQMGDGDIQTIISRENKYAKSAAIELGKNLKTKFSSGVVIISSPGYEKNKREQEIVAGLKESLLAAKVVPLEFPKSKNGKMDQMEIDQRQLGKILGLRSRASEILSRKRPMSINIIRKLSKALIIQADILIQPYETI